MTEIKICGITTLEDARLAADCGADALGFIFHKKTPRYISPERVMNMAGSLPCGIAKVGVFVNRNIPEIQEIAAACGLDFIQLQGDESPVYCSRFSSSLLIKAVSLRKREDLRMLERYPVKTFLADSREKGLYGGTGKTNDWELAAEAAKRHPLILAGGLHEGNILEAIERVAPCAVDINSGVEEVPGKKDPVKMRRIMELIRGYAKSNFANAGLFKVKR